MNTPQPQWMRQLSIVTGLALLSAASICVGGQNAPLPRDDAKLDGKVHLTPGSTTLAKVVDELSRQTGLKIDAADYLLDRKLIVTLEGLTAREALDALAELNDWKWRMTEPGRYVLGRPTIRRPTSQHDVSRAMQTALPRDFHSFLGIANWHKMTEAERGFAAFAGPYRQLLDRTRETFFETLAPVLRQEDVVPYSMLTARQQEDLLFTLIFIAFGDTTQVLYNYGPHRIEPARATLELQQGKILMVVMYQDPNDPGSGVGFGQNVVDR